jgi:predicted GH43/DUF377 family glycosyl hydrolase
MRLAAALIVLALCGCSRVVDFRLPDPGAPETGMYRWAPRPEPVIRRENAFHVDRLEAVNPQVFPFSGTLFMLYAGFGGDFWQTVVAGSSDGLDWTRGRAVNAPRDGNWETGSREFFGSALVRNGLIHYWYQAGAPMRIGLALSNDARTWERREQPVFDSGDKNDWDGGAVRSPAVVEFGGRLFLYYVGEDGARAGRLGVAVSDDGVEWKRHVRGPLLAPATGESSFGNMAVWKDRGSYWMLSTRISKGLASRMRLLRSQDGLAWKETGLTLEGGQPWNGKEMKDPCVLVAGDRVRVWYAGGDETGAFAGIHGQIGYGELIWGKP